MNAMDDAERFARQARENRLNISIDDAAELGEFTAAVAAAYSIIRDIDTAGFEPAAVFVPTPSRRDRN